MDEQIFICPYNSYHKMMEYRKWQFHIQRCGDRRGKTVYSCQFQSSHYFTNLADLIEHERHKCKFKDSEKERFDISTDELAKERKPIMVYCKYDLKHVFGTEEERAEHEKTCPGRAEHERKAAQCHQKFSQNKEWIRKAQAMKRDKEDELGGNINAPASKLMPNLRYQYIMNEPFVGGAVKTVQSSHEANVHKRRVAYELDKEEELRRENMTIDEHAEEHLTQELQHIQKLVQEQGTNLTPEDLSILRIDNPMKQLKFGLHIQEKRDDKINTLDLKVEREITPEVMYKVWGIDPDFSGCIASYVKENWLFKLRIVENPDIEDMDKRSMLYREWNEKAKELENDISTTQLFGGGPQKNKVIWYDSISSQCELQNLLKRAPRPNEILNVFFISKEVEAFKSLFMRNTEFQNTDFLIVLCADPRLNDHEIQFEMLDDKEAGMKAARQRVKQDNDAGAQSRLAEEEKQQFEHQISEREEEIKNLQAELEAANKSIRDKERKIKQDAREIERKENGNRDLRTQLHETRQSLEEKEQFIRQLEKDNSNKQEEIKKGEVRYDRLKEKSDQYLNERNKKQLEITEGRDRLFNLQKLYQKQEFRNKQLEEENSNFKKFVSDFEKHKGINLGPISRTQFVVPVPDPAALAMAETSKLSNPESLPQSLPSTTAALPDPTEDLPMIEEQTKPDLKSSSEDDEDEEEDCIDLDDFDESKVSEYQEAMRLKEERAKLLSGGSIAPLTRETSSVSPLDSLPNSLPASNPASKTKNEGNPTDLHTMSLAQLLESCMCVSCQEVPKDTLIKSCKHVPFCSKCDTQWKLKCAKDSTKPSCPICRKEYNQSQVIKVFN